jgi:hypothetical protein
LVLICVGVGCGRTGLEAEGLDEPEGDAAVIRTPLAEGSIEPNDAPAEMAVVPPPECQPKGEVCNGMDDDCNGAIDDSLAPTPCPGGGFRYCVAGRWSACPSRCEVCLPGSQRVCFHSYCLYWGVQTCASDGQGFGPCREQAPPRECAATADRYKYSAELEQCCIDNGYCCVDEHDLDRDGNRTELLGHCDEVRCGP